MLQAVVGCTRKLQLFGAIMTSGTTLLRSPTNCNDSALNEQRRDLECRCHVGMCSELHVNTSRAHHGAGHTGLFQLRLPCQHERQNLVRTCGECSAVLLEVLTPHHKQSGVEDEAVADVDAMETVGAGRLETPVSSSRTTHHIV